MVKIEDNKQRMREKMKEKIEKTVAFYTLRMQSKSVRNKCNDTAIY